MKWIAILVMLIGATVPCFALEWNISKVAPLDYANYTWAYDQGVIWGALSTTVKWDPITKQTSAVLPYGGNAVASGDHIVMWRGGNGLWSNMYGAINYGGYAPPIFDMSDDLVAFSTYLWDPINGVRENSTSATRIDHGTIAVAQPHEYSFDISNGYRAWSQIFVNPQGQSGWEWQVWIKGNEFGDGQKVYTGLSSIDNIRLWNNRIVWNESSWDVYFWSPESLTVRLDTEPGHDWMPTIYGNYVAWVKNQSGSNDGIYIAEIIPEPTSLLVLGAGIVSLGLVGRRKL